MVLQKSTVIGLYRWLLINIRNIEVGGTDKLSAIIDPTNATYKGVKFISSKPEVVKVDPYSGTISGISTGTATVSVVTYDGGFTALARLP